MVSMMLAVLEVRLSEVGALESIVVFLGEDECRCFFVGEGEEVRDLELSRVALR